MGADGLERRKDNREIQVNLSGFKGFLDPVAWSVIITTRKLQKQSL